MSFECPQQLHKSKRATGKKGRPKEMCQRTIAREAQTQKIKTQDLERRVACKERRVACKERRVACKERRVACKERRVACKERRVACKNVWRRVLSVVFASQHRD